MRASLLSIVLALGAASCGRLGFETIDLSGDGGVVQEPRRPAPADLGVPGDAALAVADAPTQSRLDADGVDLPAADTAGSPDRQVTPDAAVADQAVADRPQAELAPSLQPDSFTAPDLGALTLVDASADLPPPVDAPATLPIADVGVPNFPDLDIDTQPDVQPDLSPVPPPDLAPDISPDTEPDVSPDISPDVSPDIEPDVSPDTSPDVSPDTSPDTAPAVDAPVAPGPAPACTVAKAWYADFSVDPTTLDLNNDGMPDWRIRGGSAFPAAELVAGIWESKLAGQAFDTWPAYPFETRTIVRVRMEALDAINYGAAFWINVNSNGPMFSAVFVSLLNNGTDQTLNVYGKSSVSTSVLLTSFASLPNGMIDIELDITPQPRFVSVKVKYPGVTQSRGFGFPATGTTDANQWATLFKWDGSSGARFDSIAVFSCIP